MTSCSNLCFSAGNDGATALILASQNGNAEIVKLLLEKGSDINLQRSDGFSALMAAVKDGHADVAKLLLEKGADPRLKDIMGKTVVDYAEDAEIRKLFVK